MCSLKDFNLSTALLGFLFNSVPCATCHVYRCSTLRFNTIVQLSRSQFSIKLCPVQSNLPGYAVLLFCRKVRHSFENDFHWNFESCTLCPITALMMCLHDSSSSGLPHRHYINGGCFKTLVVMLLCPVKSRFPVTTFSNGKIISW
jgi:hypothetical protein